MSLTEPAPGAGFAHTDVVPMRPLEPSWLLQPNRLVAHHSNGWAWLSGMRRRGLRDDAGDGPGAHRRRRVPDDRGGGAGRGAALVWGAAGKKRLGRRRVRVLDDSAIRSVVFKQRGEITAVPGGV